MRDRRAQNEVIGFVIVFSAVLVATTVVGAFGVTALEDVRAATVSDNGEFAMQTVEADLTELYYGTATSSTTELSLGSASLETGEQTTISVTATQTVGGGSVSGSWTFRPVVYRTDTAAIYYENSLVVRQQRAGSVAVTDTLFGLGTGRSVVPVVQTEPTVVQSVSGGTKRLEARVTDTDTETLTSGSGTLDVEVFVDDVGGRAEVWKRTLDAEIGTSACSIGGGGTQVRCTYTTDALVVSIVTVEYDLR